MPCIETKNISGFQIIFNVFIGNKNFWSVHTWQKINQVISYSYHWSSTYLKIC